MRRRQPKHPRELFGSTSTVQASHEFTKMHVWTCKCSEAACVTRQISASKKAFGLTGASLAMDVQSDLCSFENAGAITI